MTTSESDLEQNFIGKLLGLKYEYRPDVTNRATLEQNFREKFEALNRVRLTDSELARLLGTKTLLCFLQLFIVSNRTNTYYFANNNARHFAFNADERFLPIYQFADEKNKKIAHLDDFAATFLVKCTFGQTHSRYMVLIASEQKLLMMRPYQVYQVKNLVQCIHDNCGNDYIWSTTGSGKTLTSFNGSTLLRDNPDIHKCLFVVDRKDLDRQTREEFNCFQEGCGDLPPFNSQYYNNSPFWKN